MQMRLILDLIHKP